MTYTDGNSKVTVSGVTDVILKFGNDSLAMYEELAALGSFEENSSGMIYEDWLICSLVSKS